MVLSCRFSPVFTENPTCLSRQFAASADRGFEFQKSRQLFLGTCNETLPVLAMCIINSGRSPVGINQQPEIRRLLMSFFGGD